MMPPPEVLDANQDGSVTLDEFTAGLNEMHKERFTHMDANADGVLSAEELAKRPGRPDGMHGPRGPRGPRGQGSQAAPGDGAQPPMPPAGTPPAGGPPPDGRPPMPTLEQLDTDQDGSVTEAEFTAAWSVMAKDRFTRIDTNQDGTLSMEELAARPGPGPHGGFGGPGQGRGPRR
jgi:hypothetical protein